MDGAERRVVGVAVAACRMERVARHDCGVDERCSTVDLGRPVVAAWPASHRGCIPAVVLFDTAGSVASDVAVDAATGDVGAVSALQTAARPVRHAADYQRAVVVGVGALASCLWVAPPFHSRAGLLATACG